MVTPRDEPSDTELVTRAVRGDDGAFSDLVRRHERRVYNVAYRMLGGAEDARDATQEAFLSCYRRLGSFRGDAAFTTWLHRITVNASYDLLRRRKAVPVGIEEAPEPPPSPDHAEETAGTIDTQRALMHVGPEHRAVLILHDVRGLAYEEVAAILEVPVGTVKSRLHRARVALARALAEHETLDVPSNPRRPEGASTDEG